MYIKMREQFRPNAYKIKGETCYTIGYGHSNAKVEKNETCTLEEAEVTLNKDFQLMLNLVDQNFTPIKPLNDHQRGALASWLFNLRDR